MKKARKLQFPRRGAALAVCLATAWVISRTADLSAAKAALLTSGKWATSLLELELGAVQEDGELTGLPRLVVEQSPILSQSQEAVQTFEEEQTEEVSLPETDPADQSAEEEAPSEESSEPDSSEPEPIPEESTEEDTSFPAVSLDLSGIKAGQLEVDNHTQGITPDVSACWKKEPSLTLQPAENGAQILIMHTHATEAYQMDGEDVYQESDDSRTTDENYNMIRVGEEMKAVFEDMGLSVVHDKTTYDYPGYNGSYGRSLAGIQSYLEQYPTIGVVLDVHRDALIDSDGTVYSKTTTIDGERVAQVMLVVGTNDSGLSHPNWQDNFTLSLKLQGAMLTVADSLPRAIDLRSQRFNQHLTAGSLLVEVGTSGNTLQEALAGARLFAQAAGQVYTNCIVDKD
jgi:stage II sporulation protein P